MIYPQPPDVIAQRDLALRHALADSLCHISTAARAVLGDVGPDAEPVAAAIRARRVRPGLFGAYYELVLALQSQDPAAARALWREIGQRLDEPVGSRVLPLGHPDLGPDSARYARLIDLGASPPRLLHAPPSAEWTPFPERLAAARAVLAAVDPPLAAEVDALTLDVIGAVPPAGAAFRFGGASSFMLWGALILNLERHGNVLDTLEGLVHEATHLLLFGRFHPTPPVLNPVQHRFASPLRREPRPMIGVYHATLVCARLHVLHGCLLEHRPAGLITTDWPLLETRRAEQRARFLQGYAILTEQGQLTEPGRALLDSAHAAVMDGS